MGHFPNSTCWRNVRSFWAGDFFSENNKNLEDLIQRADKKGIFWRDLFAALKNGEVYIPENRISSPNFLFKVSKAWTNQEAQTELEQVFGVGKVKDVRIFFSPFMKLAYGVGSAKIEDSSRMIDT